MIIKDFIRTVPDFPKKGIMFRDISPLLQNPKASSYCVSEFVDKLYERKIDYVIGIDSRGFIFGPQIAQSMGIGFVMARKTGKLPPSYLEQYYDLEYGQSSLCIPEGLKIGSSVHIHDDVLATGGTIEAVIKMVISADMIVDSISCIIELDELHGRRMLMERYNVSEIISLIKY